MDVEKQRVLEARIDQLSSSKNPDAVMYLTRAKELMKSRKWREAEEAVDAAARAAHVVKTLMQLLVDLKEASSRAEARRMINAGAVSVDGRVCVDPTRDMTEAKQIQVRSKVVKG